MNPIKKGLPLVTAVAAACCGTPERTATPTTERASSTTGAATARSSCCATTAAPASGEPCCAGAAQGSAEPCCATAAAAPKSTCRASPTAKTTAPLKQVVVQILFLDRTTCTRCRGTDSILDEAVKDVTVVAEARGAEVHVEKIHVQTAEQARALGFQSSPTIRVNGRDVGGDPRESNCKECGELCGSAMDCRVWSWDGKEFNAPPKALVVDGIVRELYGIATAPAAVMPREIPENLKRFFEARPKK